jgi:hypothetical protein
MGNEISSLGEGVRKCISNDQVAKKSIKSILQDSGCGLDCCDNAEEGGTRRIPIEENSADADMEEMEALLAPGAQDRVEQEAGALVQTWVDALVRGVVMVVGGSPLKVYLDASGLSLTLPSEGVTIELEAIREMIFTIAVIEGFPVPELVLSADEEVHFQFENQRSRLLFALTVKVLRARASDTKSPISIRYL